ncbi:MarR family transcriptional regulator [Rhodospirillaceae bacterium LM-1]|nr:MarR family transcriptional regulator [Rhodospirillaceae bacterium LM-1]
MDGAQFDLDRFTPYLLNRAAGRIVLAFEKDLDSYDISLGQWRVLACIWHEGTPMQSDIVRHTSIDPSTLSRMIGGMEKRGLLKREKSDLDSRAVLVRLTGKGRKIAEALIPKALAVERSALEGFTPNEVAKLHGLLRRIYANLGG